MQTDIQVSKCGDGLAVVIPGWMAQEAKISEGDTLELFINASGEIILRSPIRKYELEDLLSKITPENRHKEIDWDGLDLADSYRDCHKP